MKKGLKKLALMGITGGVILASQNVNSALPSQQPGLNPDELIAALSWTCRKANCGKPTQLNSNENKTNVSDNSCGAKNGCNGSDNLMPETQEQFVQQLNIEGRRLFKTLDDEGKKLAMRLAKQYSNKNQAVKHAAQQTGN